MNIGHFWSLVSVKIIMFSIDWLSLGMPLSYQSAISSSLLRDSGRLKVGVCWI